MSESHRWNFVDAGGIKVAYDRDTMAPDFVGTVAANLDVAAEAVVEAACQISRMHANSKVLGMGGHGFFSIRSLTHARVIEATVMLQGRLVRYRLSPKHADGVVGVWMLGWAALHSALSRAARHIAWNTRSPKLRRRLLAAARSHLQQRHALSLSGRVLLDTQLLDRRAFKRALRTGEGTSSNPFVSVWSTDGKLTARFCTGHWFVQDPTSGVDTVMLFNESLDSQWTHAWDRFTSMVDKLHGLDLRQGKPFPVVIAQYHYDNAVSGGSGSSLLGF